MKNSILVQNIKISYRLNARSMASDSRLETAVDKILNQSESELLSILKTSLDESNENLLKSESNLEQEYDKIIDQARKESDKLGKQIIGSSDLESRNKQLLLVEESVQKVFAKAIEKIGSTNRDDNYSKLIKILIDDSIKALRTSDVTVYTNSKDRDTVKSILSQFSGAELSSDSIDCLGGVQVRSKDGTMSFDNTIDARVERLKPLIRKKIASNFGLGN